MPQFAADTADAIRTDILARLTPEHPDRAARITGFAIYRVTETAGPMCGLYEPSLSVIIQGAKRLHIGDETLVYDEKHFLLTAVGLPILAQIEAATPERPYYCLALRIDLAKVREIIAEIGPQPVSGAEVGLSMALGTATAELFDAFRRLIALLDQPHHIPFLADQIEREIYYRLLTGDQGARLRRYALAGSQSSRVARAVEWLKQNYTQPLRVEDLADIAAMGVSTLHHHFRAMTAMSPLQFQKHLRLNQARMLMLGDNLDAATAALRVGYESPTQFNREYRRLFGAPPMRDIKTLRAMPAANQPVDLDIAG